MRYEIWSKLKNRDKQSSCVQGARCVQCLIPGSFGPLSVLFFFSSLGSCTIIQQRFWILNMSRIYSQHITLTHCALSLSLSVSRKISSAMWCLRLYNIIIFRILRWKQFILAHDTHKYILVTIPETNSYVTHLSFYTFK